MFWSALCGGAVFVTVCFPLANTDIWWHLATGREILAQGGLPWHDPFAAGTEGVRWINLHWLFQLGAYGLYQLGGVALLVLAKAGVVALCAVLLVAAVLPVRRAGQPGESTAAGADQQNVHGVRGLQAGVAALLVAQSIFLTHQLVFARPIVITLAALALFFFVLERYGRAPRPRLLLWLLPVQLVWANGQGGLQLLGPALVLSYLIGGGLEHLLARTGLLAGAPPAGRALAWLAGALGALLLCGLLTPFGAAGLELPWRLLGRIDPLGAELFRLNVTENVPPWLLEKQPHVPLAVASFKWLAAASFLSFAPCVRRCRAGSLARLLLLCGLLVLALWANRNILLFAWLAGPVLAVNLLGGRLLPRAAGQRIWRKAAHTALICGVAALVLLRVQGAAGEPPIAAPAPFRLPVRAADKLRELGLDQGQIFTSLRYGSYLIWALHPRAKPTMDGRLVLRSAAQLAEHLDLVDRPALFAAYCQQKGIGAAILPAAFPGRYLSLVVQLYHDPRWQLLETDGTQTLFVERRRLPAHTQSIDLGDPQQVQRIAAALRQAATPAIAEQGLINLGRLLAAVGELEQSAELLRGLVSWQARLLRAGVLLQQGQLAEARRVAKSVLAARPGDADSLVLLAMVEIRQGRAAAAIDLLELALAHEPHHAGSRQLLAQLAQLERE